MVAIVLVAPFAWVPGVAHACSTTPRSAAEQVALAWHVSVGVVVDVDETPPLLAMLLLRRPGGDYAIRVVTPLKGAVPEVQHVHRPIFGPGLGCSPWARPKVGQRIVVIEDGESESIYGLVRHPAEMADIESAALAARYPAHIAARERRHMRTLRSVVVPGLIWWFVADTRRRRRRPPGPDIPSGGYTPPGY